MYQLSKKTLAVPASLFTENRTRLIEALRAKVPSGTVVFLKGGEDVMRYNTDMNETPFRQESYFFWAFGVHEAGCHAIIDISTGKSTLFPPRLPADYATWEGAIHTAEWFKTRYEVDDVIFDDLTFKAALDCLQKLAPKSVLLLSAFNTDSNAYLPAPTFKGLEKFATNITILYPTMAELRVFKTDKELEVLRYANKVACEAHKMAMKEVQPGLYEYQLESIFRHVSYFKGGCRHLSYICIAPSGSNSSILHYGHANAPNDKLIADGDMCLFDMGPEYCCYASDVTASFPANGKFTEKQKIVYNAVLEANLTVFKEAKPGVRWTDMHILAEKIILTHLKNAGLLQGDIDAMVSARLGGVFMPHGLGHFMGVDVHDVGGYLGDATPRSTLPGLKSLRTTRTLKPRMVITIEPGCYFIDYLLDNALADPQLSKFIVKEKLEEYRGFGGVRIEDDVVIGENGNENMTRLPRTVEEIEKFMSGKEERSLDEITEIVQQKLKNLLV